MDTAMVTKLEEPPTTDAIRSTIPAVSALAVTVPIPPPDASRRSSFLGTLMPDANGPLPNRYETQQAIGQGGMGVVVSAMDRDLARPVAVKQLRSTPPQASDVARFLREAQVTAQLEHPGVVPIHDVGRDDEGQFYYVMRLLRGGQTLRQLIDGLRSGNEALLTQFTFERRVKIVQQLAQILSYAHSRGVVHRDVKPENVMLGPFGEVYLIDWGLAKVKSLDGSTAGAALALPESVKPAETAAGTIAGTPLYMSPEQANGTEVTALSDIYSLGALMYELFTTRHYLGDERPASLEALLKSVLTKDPVAADSFADSRNGYVPRALAFACDRALAKRPSERFASAKELEAALERWLEGDTPVACPVTLQLWLIGRWRRVLHRHPQAVGIATLLAMGAVLGLAVWGVIHALGA